MTSALAMLKMYLFWTIFYLLWTGITSFETITFFSDEYLTNNIEMVPVFIMTITNIPMKISIRTKYFFYVSL